MSSRSASLLLATAVLLLPVDVMAQRGHGGFASHGIQNGAYPGSVPAARPIGPNIGGRPYPLRTDLPPPTGLIPPAAAYTGISPGAYKFQAGFGGHYGRGGGGALLAAPFYYPYLGYGSSLNTFPGYNEQIDPNAQAFAAAQDSLGEQIRQLSEELDSVRRQVVTPPTPPVAPATPQPPPAMVPYGGDPASASQPPIVVVLKNGQRLPVQSYAVMNGLIWDFSKQPVRKIPVSTVDIAESVKASEANGTEFPDLSSASRVSVSH
jgi:hypothetical protein